jgi:hypothetical protein
MWAAAVAQEVPFLTLLSRLHQELTQLQWALAHLEQQQGLDTQEHKV